MIKEKPNINRQNPIVDTVDTSLKEVCIYYIMLVFKGLQVVDTVDTVDTSLFL